MEADTVVDGRGSQTDTTLSPVSGEVRVPPPLFWAFGIVAEHD